MSHAATLPVEESPSVNRTLLVISIMLATLMQVIDTTIANVALPQMQGSLSATRDQVSWVLTSYIVAAAIATPATGWLASVMGRKRLLVVAITGFVAASALCGMATSIGAMVAFRVLQGLFGAALVPISQSSLLDAFPTEKHGAAMALWGVGIMIGPILGPPLGGWLTESYSWHWVFLINVPIGVLALLGVMASVPADETRKSRIDGRGFLLLALGIGALQLMLDRWEQEDGLHSLEIQLELALAFLGFYLYWVHWRGMRLGLDDRRERPFVNLSLLADRNFAVGTLFIFIIGIVLFATLALLPPYLAQLMSYPTVTIGLLLAPRGVGTMISMMLVGRLLARRVDPRLPIFVGLILMVRSLWLMTQFSADMPAGPIVWAGIIQGLGLGLVFVPVSTIAYATLPGKDRTEAAGIFSLMRNLGSSIGISLVFTVLSRGTQANHASLAAGVTPFGPPLPPAWSGADGLMALNAELTRQAAAVAYVSDFWLMLVLTTLALPLLLLLRPVKANPARA